VEKFIKAEQDNYSLFTYVKDLIQENDKLDEEIKQAEKIKKDLIEKQEKDEMHCETVVN
jgi:hypothetical protein